MTARTSGTLVSLLRFRYVADGLLHTTMSSSRSGLAATIAAVAVFAAACGSQPGPFDAFRIATAPPDSQLLTILNGQLSAQVSNDGTACLSVTFGQSRTAVIWPAGFTARGNPIAVYDADGKLLAVAGQQVKVGGGLVSSSQSRKAPGCAGISQTIVAGPLKTPPEAIPGSQEYADLQVGDMQQIVNSFPTVFGGLWGDPATKVVTISIAPNADNSAAAAAMAEIARIGTQSDPHVGDGPKKWRAGFVTVGPSLSVLEVVRSKVPTAQPWRTDVGKHLVSWGIDPVHHAVNVGVDLITPTISEDASSEFGGLVILETSEPAAALH